MTKPNDSTEAKNSAIIKGRERRFHPRHQTQVGKPVKFNPTWSAQISKACDDFLRSRGLPVGPQGAYKRANTGN